MEESAIGDGLIDAAMGAIAGRRGRGRSSSSSTYPAVTGGTDASVTSSSSSTWTVAG